MKTAREVSTSVWDSIQRGDNVIDAYAAAIEADRRELVEACAKEAEDARVLYDDVDDLLRQVAARVRALIPKEDSRP